VPGACTQPCRRKAKPLGSAACAAALPNAKPDRSPAAGLGAPLPDTQPVHAHTRPHAAKPTLDRPLATPDPAPTDVWGRLVSEREENPPAGPNCQRKEGREEKQKMRWAGSEPSRTELAQEQRRPKRFELVNTHPFFFSLTSTDKWAPSIGERC